MMGIEETLESIDGRLQEIAQWLEQIFYRLPLAEWERDGESKGDK